MKCKHENITIQESGSWVTEHNRELNGTWWHNNDPGEYTATINITCHQCGKKWRYSKYHLPAWLKKYWDKAMERD